MTGPIGDRVFIDGKDAFAYYHADLIDYPTITAGEITASYNDLPGLLIPYQNTQAAKTATWSFYVHGETRERREINTAALIEACRFATLKIQYSDLEYLSILTEVISEPTGIDQFNRVQLTFATVQRGRLRTASLPQDKVYCETLVDAPCRITLKPTSTISNFTILGITINKLNANDTFVIDGLSRSGNITRNGNNAFLDTDLIEFPALSSGWDELNMSHEIPGEIEYYPVY